MEATYWAIITMTLVNIVGWAITIYRNGKESSKREGKYEERVKSLFNRVNNLPCQSDPDYERQLGVTNQKIENIKNEVERIKTKLNSR